MWRCTIRKGVESVNDREEMQEKQQKDEKKHRCEGQQMAAEAPLQCMQSPWLHICCSEQSWPHQPLSSEAPPASAWTVCALSQVL